MNTITISIWRWRRAIKELRRRGQSRRESGAFFLGDAERKKVSRVVFYDDLDPHSLDSGIIRLNGAAFIPLWEICRERNLDVLFDVHTHPTSSVGQSVSDQTNPTVRRQGHTAVIVPNFAKRNRFGFKGIGIYEYLGNHKWRTCGRKESRLKLTLF